MLQLSVTVLFFLEEEKKKPVSKKFALVITGKYKLHSNNVIMLTMVVNSLNFLINIS